MGSDKNTLVETIGQPGVCIPTFNAGSNWEKCIKALSSQTVQADLLVIDSGSTDDTVDIAKSFGATIVQINKSDFNHGGTRNKGAELLSKSDIIVFLTQDAILAMDNSLENILGPFKNPQVAVVTGRQLPHSNATPIATHARLFNYPEKTSIKTQKDIPRLGIKTAFCSNSFSAYRTSAFREHGGFPERAILGEDMYLAAKLILDGKAIVYNADAQAFHSHNYTLIEEFRRYFDTGVFHAQEPWLLREFDGPGGEGKRFVASELRYLAKYSPKYIPEALIRTILKLTAYHLGKHNHIIPRTLQKALSMHKSYWK